MDEEEFKDFLSMVTRLRKIVPSDLYLGNDSYKISREALQFSFAYIYEKLAEMLEQLQNAPENDYFENLRNILCNSLAVLNYMGAIFNTFLPPEEK
jgi:hypothetical protein